MTRKRVACATVATILAALLAANPSLAASDPLAPVAIGPAPDAPAKKPVTEDIFGTKVTDDWRYMEALGPQTLDWMREQGDYTRLVLDAIKPLPALQARAAAFTGSFGFVNDYSTYGGRTFYQERAPGSDNFDLMVRGADGKTRKLVDVSALRAAHGGEPYAINYILPSPDGAKVAVGISAGGSEAAKMFVYDAATGAQIAGPLDRARFGPTGWTNDSKQIFLLREKKMAPGDPETDLERFVSLELWALSGEPVPLAGAGTGHGPTISPDEFPFMVMEPGGTVAAIASKAGVANEIGLWTAPVDQATDPTTVWAPLATPADGITGGDIQGDEIFLLSHKDAPTFQVLVLKAGQPLSAAKVLIPAKDDRIITDLHVAADGLYVVTSDGVYSHLLRVPKGTDKIEEIALPAKGHIGALFSDPRMAGIDLDLSSWTLQPTEYAYDPATGQFTDLHVGTRGNIDAAAFDVQDLKARAKDGAEVPLSLVVPKTPAAPGKAITVIEAYGSYGISELADFSSRRATFMKEGITYGVCHVRGGGELGDAWRLAGKDDKKPNTWRDLIACADDLVARGITDPSRLFIIGGSAGGITMGRAMEERPELFAGVLDLVPAANTLRAEFSPNGPPNVPEFGTIKTLAGFKNLYAMDSVINVKPGVAYPPVMISTGLNDPRVSPWEPAKFAAALKAAGDPNPVLLRIDAQAGHGIGSTRSQGDSLNADQIAFVFWRAGLADWRPDAAK
jgi:prolyl oligopeptidase